MGGQPVENLNFGHLWSRLVIFGHLYGNQTRLENWSAEKMARNGKETVKFYVSGQALTKVDPMDAQVFKPRGRQKSLKFQRKGAFLSRLWEGRALQEYDFAKRFLNGKNGLCFYRTLTNLFSRQPYGSCNLQRPTKLKFCVPLKICWNGKSWLPA